MIRSFFFGLLVSGMLLLLGNVSAQEKNSPKLPPELAWIPRTSEIFLSIRYDRLNKTPLGPAPIFLTWSPSRQQQKVEEDYLGYPLTEIERVTFLYPEFPTFDKRKDAYPLIALTRTKPFNRQAIQKRLRAASFSELIRIQSNSKEDIPPEPKYLLGEADEPHYLKERGLLYFIDNRSTVLFLENAFSYPTNLIGKFLASSESPGWEEAIRTANREHILVGAMTGKAIGKGIELLGAPVKQLSDLAKADSVIVTFDIGEETILQVRFLCTTEAIAKQVQETAKTIPDWATKQFKAASQSVEKDKYLVDWQKPFAALMEAMQKQIEIQQTNSQILLTLKLHTKKFFPDVQTATQSTMKMLAEQVKKVVAANNLKRLGLAIHNFLDVNGTFPFDQRPEGLKIHPNLSWRVALLPYFEEDELFRQFKLDEPWDSEHNKKLIPKMPKIYAPPEGIKAEKGHTFIRTFSGKETFGSIKTIPQVTDGTSKTFLLAEGGEAVIWTKPDELVYDANKPLPKFGGHFEDGFWVILGDASALFVDKSSAEKSIRAWITTSGNEPEEEYNQLKSRSR
jgi:hypothetical protein